MTTTLRRKLQPTAFKEEAELGYWRTRHRSEGLPLDNSHYRDFYTRHIGLADGDYDNKHVLDIGCGPRGSLEWATMAASRTGLDPLARSYSEFKIEDQAMRYVQGIAEDLPFPNYSFDVVAAFNSLDHVKNPDRAISEMGRVTRPSGLGLLAVEVGHAPTATEPHQFGWDLLDRFENWTVAESWRFSQRDDRGMYGAIRSGEPWKSGPGWLVARLRKHAL